MNHINRIKRTIIIIIIWLISLFGICIYKTLKTQIEILNQRANREISEGQRK